MKRNYEPPLSRVGEGIMLKETLPLYPGVFGYAVPHNGLIYIPEIHAEKEGSGSVGAFLDVISPKCRVVNVVSPRLQEMLVRRDFQLHYEETEMGKVDIWKPPTRERGAA